MTVCLAAICRADTIFAAADRMITGGGDVEFEPNNPDAPSAKIAFVTSSIVLLFAGDLGVQREIAREVFNSVNGRIRSEPTNWWRVKDVTQLYVDHYNALLQRRISSLVLAPYGLTLETFISKQREMSEDFLRRVRQEIDAHSLGNLETIVAGIDQDGGLLLPHIYRIIGNQIICEDSIGFAAIGSGSRHAESQFMLSNHQPWANDAETLFLVYLAKRRAEIAPGVGKFTDILSVGPQLGMNAVIGREIITKLEAIYNKHVKTETSAANRSNLAVKRYAEELKAKSLSTRASVQDAPKADSATGAATSTGSAPPS